VEYSWVGQIPQKQVLEICRQSDVFVFPSLAEGFGLVILEAMASGIPVITTDRTGGPEVIEHGQDGWIVPAGDVDALVGAFELVQEMQRFLPEIGAAARRKAELWNWGRYRRELRNSLAEIPTGVAAC
jgi:glycosyltransferase involved in cell wall biosynthesis